jgi:hypothetical protein
MTLLQATAVETEPDKFRLALEALTKENNPFLEASALVVLLSRSRL